MTYSPSVSKWRRECLTTDGDTVALFVVVGVVVLLVMFLYVGAVVTLLVVVLLEDSVGEGVGGTVVILSLLVLVGTVGAGEGAVVDVVVTLPVILLKTGAGVGTKAVGEDVVLGGRRDEVLATVGIGVSTCVGVMKKRQH